MAMHRLRAIARALAGAHDDPAPPPAAELTPSTALVVAPEVAASPAAKETELATVVDPNELPTEMSETEKFMWDLQGFLTVDGFLSPGEVDALNGAFDANWVRTRRAILTTSFSGCC